MFLTSTIVTVVFSILCLLLSQCNAIVPLDLMNNKGHGLSQASDTFHGRMVNHQHSKHHVPAKEVMAQFNEGRPEDTMQRGEESNRLKRNTPSANESTPEYFTHDFNDLYRFALPVYTGRVKNEVIFVLTYDFGATGIVSNLYRSSDYGETFENINARVGNGAALQPAVNIGPTNHQQIYLADANAAIIYVSTNEGATFTTRQLSPSTIDPSTITPHTSMDNWFTAHDPTNNALYVSRDLGSTPCIKIADNVTANDRVQWGVFPYDQDLSTVYFLSNKVFYYQQYPYGKENQKRFGDAVDFNDFVVIDRYIFLEYLANTSTTLYQLYMSADRQPFQEAKVPTRAQGHYQYIVAQVKTNQALLINRHGNGEYVLYFSDETGVYFSESLGALAVIEVVPNQAYYIDLAVSMNLTTYVANQIAFTSTGVYLRTLISFNAGGSWNLINAPNGTMGCSQCSLHFHMDISNIWRLNVYDRDSAPGILLAIGGVSPYFNSSLADLYISRDGGFTWSLALEGLWQISILDHGSIIVATPYYLSAENGSTTFMYSCDEGITWTTLQFTDVAVHVAGLRTEPGETTTSVVLYGVHPNTTSWVLSVIDFMNVFPRECEADDYYNWTPYDGYASNGCLLGAQVTIERRKRDVCCLNTQTYTRVTDYQICECTLEDYRCDYGFRPINYDVNVCVRDYGVNFTDCVNGERYYSRSLGYRKVSGTICDGGIEDRFTPENLTCSSTATEEPGSGSSSSSASSSSYQAPFIAMLVLFIIALVAVVGLVILVFVCYATRSQKSSVGNAGNTEFQSYTDTSSSTGIVMAPSAPYSKEMEAGYN